MGASASPSGSHPSGHAASGVDGASRFDPSRGALLDLPWPPKELTPNAKRRKHWRVYQPIAKQYRADCRKLAEDAHIRGSAILSVTFVPPDRRKRDDDGMIGAFKAGRDGIADALGCDDHDFRPSYHFAEPCKPGKVIVCIGAPCSGKMIEA